MMNRREVTADSNAISYVLWHQTMDPATQAVVCDDKGQPTYTALTKPASHAETCQAYYSRCSEGVDAKLMRITPATQRPDSLGRW